MASRVAHGSTVMQSHFIGRCRSSLPRCTVPGSVATISNGVTGTVAQALGVATITWCNGIAYTSACVASQGNMHPRPQHQHSTLTQYGGAGTSSEGWSYTVSGSVATISNGVTGTVAQALGVSTITWATTLPTLRPLQAPTTVFSNAVAVGIYQSHGLHARQHAIHAVSCSPGM